MEEGNTESAGDLQILREIEENVMNHFDFGFDSKALDVLDRDDATRGEIESLKELLSPGIVLRLFGLGNSSHYGRLGMGRFTSLFDVVLRLGTETTKAYILASSLFVLRREKEFIEFEAKSFIISILGRYIGRQMGLKDEDVRKVELSGLFFKIGEFFPMLYQAQEKKRLHANFIAQYRSRLALRAIELFELPPFLKEVIPDPYFRLRSAAFGLSSLVRMAHAVVEEDFRLYGKMIIQSPLPDSDGITTSTYGFTLAKEMEAMGLQDYLEIIPVLSRTQQIHQLKITSQMEPQA